MINGYVTNTSELAGTEITKFILSRIVKNHDNIEEMAEELDSNKRLILEIILSFIDTG